MTDQDLFWLVLVAIAWGLGRWWGHREGIRDMIEQVLLKPEQLTRIAQMVEAAGLEEASEEAAEPLRIDIDQGRVFLYLASNGEFMAWGPDLEAAMDRLAERFPDRRFEGRLTPEQAKVLNIKP